MPPPGGRVWAGAASRRGRGETGFPHAPAPQGDGEIGFPHAPTRGRVWEGKALPGEPCYPLADAGRRPAHPGPDLREGLGGQSPHAGGWGNRVSPRPAGVWGNRVSLCLRPREGLGGQSPPRRTLLSPCGCGPEARAPGSRPTGGSGRAQPSQEQPFFIPSVCGGAAWTATVNIGSRRGVWGTRVSPYLSGRGPEARTPGSRPTGRSGRAQPSQEQPFFIPSVCGGAAWTATVNIGARRGAWGNRVSPYLSGRGPEARAPRPRPLGGCGRAAPSQE